MRKFFWKFLLVGMACLPLVSLANSYFDLQKIEHPELKSPKIIEANSATDFWILDQRGLLIHFAQGQWNIYTIPENNRLTGFNCVAVKNNVFLISGYDENWHSQIYWFRNGRWKKDRLQLTNPVKFLNVTADGTIYLAGDWATFYRYQDGSWYKIQLPFKASYFFFFFSGKEMYLASRGEGLYKYDGQKVTMVPVQAPPTVEIVKMRKDSTGRLFCASNIGQVFQWNGSLFEKTERDLPDSLSYSFQYIYWRNVKMPNRFHLQQIVPLKPQGALVVSKKGNLYQLKAVNHPFFMDFTEKYYLNRFKDTFVNGAFFVYWNEDGYPDLYLMSHSDYSNWQFYLNQPDHPFEVVTLQSGFRTQKGDYSSLPLDLNNDGRNDLAVLQSTSSGNRLKYFLQAADHRLRPFGETAFTNINYSRRSFKYLYCGDFDGNGLIDPGLSTYFNHRLKKGTQVLLYNHFQAMHFDTLRLQSLAKHYTVQTIWAELTGDDENDLLLVNQWDPLSILVSAPGSNSFVEQSLPGENQDAPAGAVVFDYDNDGDLDILYSSAFHALRLLTNRGHGQFDSIFQPAGFAPFNRQKLPLPILRFLLVFDVNNDGFEDVFFSLNDPDAPRNYLFINQQGSDFVESAETYGMAQPALRAAVCGDVDHDGDMDLFGFNDEQNVLWINNLDRSTFIELTVEGVRSNRAGLGSRIWVYKAGHLNDPNFLVAYRQLPNAAFAANLSNQLVFHIGLPDSGRYDLRLQFYHGQTKVLRNVPAGTFLRVKESGLLASVWYRWPGLLLGFFSWRENQIYVVLTLLIVTILFFAIRLGAGRLGWKNTATVSVALYMFTVYWVTLLGTMNSPNPFYKFLMPPGAVILNLVFIFSYSLLNLQHLFGTRNRESLEEELLKHLLIFNHGEAGSKNLIALQMLLNNPPEAAQKLDEYRQLIARRFQIFKEYNLPVLKRIHSLLQELQEDDEQYRELSEKLVFFENGCCEHLERMRVEINQLYSIIRRLKEEWFAKFSCDPEEVILQLVNLLPGSLNVSIFKDYQSKVMVFIKREDLYFVLDNLLQNARRAVQNLSDGYIKITLNKQTTGLIIQVRNNGPGIPSEKRAVLFEEQMEGKKGKGMGLAHSRKILEKYQAKIRLEEEEQTETVFSIELRRMV